MTKKHLKTISFLLSFCLLGLFLNKTNPKTKDAYVRRVTQDMQSLCCETTLTSTANPCEVIRPVTRPIVRSLVYLYTDPPKNYVFFTRYTTRLPSHTIHGVGVAGQFIRWNAYPNNEAACFF